jgi:hypothetical protein
VTYSLQQLAEALAAAARYGYWPPPYGVQLSVALQAVCIGGWVTRSQKHAGRCYRALPL